MVIGQKMMLVCGDNSGERCKHLDLRANMDVDAEVRDCLNGGDYGKMMVWGYSFWLVEPFKRTENEAFQRNTIKICPENTEFEGPMGNLRALGR